VAPDYVEPPKRKQGKYLKVSGKKRSRICLEFGNSFFLDSFLRKSGFCPVIDAVGYGNADTLRTLVFYYRKREKAGKADPIAGSDGIDCGDSGILIDSTGLPNGPHMPFTAISNHNGTVSEEARLIYVVQQGTGFPLFFSCIAGNVVDASTVKNVVAHLKKNGIDTNFAILDAGYYNGINADALYEAKISFLTRVHSNDKVFTDAVRDYRASLECRENFVTYPCGTSRRNTCMRKCPTCT